MQCSPYLIHHEKRAPFPHAYTCCNIAAIRSAGRNTLQPVLLKLLTMQWSIHCPIYHTYFVGIGILGSVHTGGVRSGTHDSGCRWRRSTRRGDGCSNSLLGLLQTHGHCHRDSGRPTSTFYGRFVQIVET